MRVALVCPYSLSIPGGVQGQVMGIARALRKLGHEARVLAPTDGPPPAPFVTSVGPSTNIETNGSISPIAPGKDAARRLLEALRGFRPDVLHLHEPIVPGPPSAALLGTRIPSVGTFHTSADRRDTFYRWLGKPASGVARLITIRTAVSEEARRTAQENLGGSYAVLPNGIDIDPIASAEPYPTTGPTVLFIGRHEPRKGLEVLLDAWERLDSDAVLWVVSDGPQTAALSGRGVARVEWIGRITEAEKARRLRAATVFCAPALGGESFGMVILEAIAASAAVVASDIPGFHNVVRPGVEAVLVPPNDPAALADGLASVLGDPARRAALAAAGRRRAEEFSMARLARRFVPVYEAAVACAPA